MVDGWMRAWCLLFIFVWSPKWMVNLMDQLQVWLSEAFSQLPLQRIENDSKFQWQTFFSHFCYSKIFHVERIPLFSCLILSWFVSTVWRVWWSSKNNCFICFIQTSGLNKRRFSEKLGKAQGTSTAKTLSSSTATSKAAPSMPRISAKVTITTELMMVPMICPRILAECYLFVLMVRVFTIKKWWNHQICLHIQ